LNKLRNLILKCHTAWYWLSEGTYDVYVALTDWRPVLTDLTSIWVGVMLCGCLNALVTIPDHPLLGCVFLLCCASSIKISLATSDNTYARAYGTLEARQNMLKSMEVAVINLQQQARDPKQLEWRVLQQAVQDLYLSNLTAMKRHEQYRQGMRFRAQQWCYEKYQFLTGCHRRSH
jgi:hypothetical protein